MWFLWGIMLMSAVYLVCEGSNGLPCLCHGKRITSKRRCASRSDCCWNYAKGACLTPERPPRCPEGEPIISEFDIVNELNPSVFDDLTLEEIASVQHYLHQQDKLNLRRDWDDVSVGSSYIFLIERMDALKSDVLRFLNGRGPKPKRYALVILYRGDLPIPVIEHYQVGPLPGINSFTKTKTIPYSKRPWYGAADEAAAENFIMKFMARIDFIAAEITGGYTYNNCSDYCLTWVSYPPARLNSHSRYDWLSIHRYLDGYYIQPIGLQVRANLGSVRWEEWYVDQVWLRGHRFADIEDLLANYYTIKHDVIKPLLYDPEDPNLYSSANYRGDPIPNDPPRRGPVSFMPDGRRYSLNKHHVEWQGWEFDFSLRTVRGLGLHNVRFKSESILYELTLSDFVTLYQSASTPGPSRSSYTEIPYFFGLTSFELFPGVDCPKYATFFDFAHFFSFEPFKLRNSACLFEWNTGIPLRRHWETDFEGSYLFWHGMPGNALILRTVITMLNYDYIVDFVFHQNGVLEVSNSLSGYILASYYRPNWGQRGGFQVAPDTQGLIHNHLFHYRVDLDIKGTKNRYETLDLKSEVVDDPIDPGTNLYRHYFEHSLKTTEREALLQYDFEKPKYMVIYNERCQNAYGNSRGYRIMPKSLLLR